MGGALRLSQRAKVMRIARVLLADMRDMKAEASPIFELAVGRNDNEMVIHARLKRFVELRGGSFQRVHGHDIANGDGTVRHGSLKVGPLHKPEWHGISRRHGKRREGAGQRAVFDEVEAAGENWCVKCAGAEFAGEVKEIQQIEVGRNRRWRAIEWNGQPLAVVKELVEFRVEAGVGRNPRIRIGHRDPHHPSRLGGLDQLVVGGDPLKRIGGAVVAGTQGCGEREGAGTKQ